MNATALQTHTLSDGPKVTMVAAHDILYATSSPAIDALDRIWKHLPHRPVKPVFEADFRVGLPRGPKSMRLGRGTGLSRMSAEPANNLGSSLATSALSSLCSASLSALVRPRDFATSRISCRRSPAFKSSSWRAAISASSPAIKTFASGVARPIRPSPRQTVPRMKRW